MRYGYKCCTCGSGFSTYLPLSEVDRPLTPKEKLIRDLYLDGLTMHEIGRIFNMTRSRVQQLLAQQPGFERLPWSCFVQKQRLAIIELHLLEWHASAIGRVLGVTTLQVVRLLQANGFSPHLKDLRIGCEKCNVSPYALGLCTRCYRNYKNVLLRGEQPEFSPGFSLAPVNVSFRHGKGKTSQRLLARLREDFPLPGDAQIRRVYENGLRWRVQAEGLLIESSVTMRKCLARETLRWSELGPGYYGVV